MKWLQNKIHCCAYDPFNVEWLCKQENFFFIFHRATAAHWRRRERGGMKGVDDAHRRERAIASQEKQQEIKIKI